MFRIATLHEQPVDTRRHKFTQEADGREAGEHNDPGIGTPAPHLPERLDALGIGHGNVEGQKVGFVLAHHGDGFKAVLGLSHDIDPAGLGEYLLDTRTHQCMIVGNDRRHITVFG